MIYKIMSKISGLGISGFWPCWFDGGLLAVWMEMNDYKCVNYLLNPFSGGHTRPNLTISYLRLFHFTNYTRVRTFFISPKFIGPYLKVWTCHHLEQVNFTTMLFSCPSEAFKYFHFLNWLGLHNRIIWIKNCQTV